MWREESSGTAAAWGVLLGLSGRRSGAAQGGEEVERGLSERRERGVVLGLRLDDFVHGQEHRPRHVAKVQARIAEGLGEPLRGLDQRSEHDGPLKAIADKLGLEFGWINA